MAHVHGPSTQEAEEEGKFETSLAYVMSSRPPPPRGGGQVQNETLAHENPGKESQKGIALAWQLQVAGSRQGLCMPSSYSEDRNPVCLA